MVDTTISPIQDFTTVKEGVQDNLLANVFSAGTEIVSAFSDAGKEKKKNVFLSDFETRQISLIDALDQGAPGVTSAITRSRLRANYTAAIAEFPQLREDIEKAYSGILSRNGLGTVGQAVTPEEKLNIKTLDTMNQRGLVPVEGFANAQEQAEALTTFQGALQAESELKIFTAGIAAQQAQITLNASEQQVQDAELARLSGNVIRTGASTERLRLTSRLADIRNSIGTDGYDLNQALKDMELEKLGFEQTVAELEALPGADSDLIKALRKPIDALFTMETQLADGTIDKNAYDKGVESAVALEKALLVGNPVVARIAATSELVGQLPPTTLGILNTITMKSFNDAMLNGSLGKPSDTTVDDPEEATGVKAYVDSIRNFMRVQTDLSQTEQVELTSHVTGILEGITRFSQVHHDDPTTARYFMDFLASNEFASYVSDGSIPAEVVASARDAILSTYDDTIEPLIRQKFLEDNIQFLTEVEIKTADPFALSETETVLSIGGEAPTPSNIIAVATSEGIHFRVSVREGMTAHERRASEQRARELNREIGPAINTWVKGVAHISGSTDYEAVMSRAIQDLTGQAPEGLDVESLLGQQGAVSFGGVSFDPPDLGPEIGANPMVSAGFLEGAGFTREQAAGIIGNLIVESGGEINPEAVGDNGNAFGIAQWNGPRMRAFKQWAADSNKPEDSLETQLEYLVLELNSTESRAKSELQKATTAEEAALIFSKWFERPGVPHNERRVAAANKIFDAWGS
jgi:hypothetical protein